MNRAMYIVLIPTLLVAAGYVVVLREMGISPGYLPLIAAVVLFLGATYGLSRRPSRRGKNGTERKPALDP